MQTADLKSVAKRALSLVDLTDLTDDCGPKAIDRLCADAQTPHQSVVTVMDAARLAGLYRLTFAARQSGEPDH